MTALDYVYSDMEDNGEASLNDHLSDNSDKTEGSEVGDIKPKAPPSWFQAQTRKTYCNTMASLFWIIECFIIIIQTVNVT